MAITTADWADCLEPRLNEIWHDAFKQLKQPAPLFKIIFEDEDTMTLYEYVIVSRPKKKKKTPRILEGPELAYAESPEDLKNKLYYEGNDPKGVDILVRPF